MAPRRQVTFYFNGFEFQVPKNPKKRFFRHPVQCIYFDCLTFPIITEYTRNFFNFKNGRLFQETPYLIKPKRHVYICLSVVRSVKGKRSVIEIHHFQFSFSLFFSPCNTILLYLYYIFSMKIFSFLLEQIEKRQAQRERERYSLRVISTLRAVVATQLLGSVT